MTHVLITDYIAPPAELEQQALGSGYRLDFLHHLQAGARTEALARAEAVAVWHHHIDDAFLASTPKLKLIVRYGVGFDNVDVAACQKHDVIFCNNPDYGVNEVSDTAVAFILAANRRFLSYNALAAASTESWQERVFSQVRRLTKYRVGLVGCGRIGGAVALKLRAMGADVSIFDPYQPAGIEKVYDVRRYGSLLELAKNSDVLSLHCPLTRETRGLFSKDVLAALPPEASVVNTARGPIVGCIDEAFAAVERGQLYGLYLDVLPEEPPKPGSAVHDFLTGKRFGGLKDRIIITPHTAYHSRDAAEEMRSNVGRMIRDYFEHGLIRNRITPEMLR